MFESTMIPSALPSTSTYTVFLTGKTKCIEVEGDFHVLVIKHTSSYLYSLLCGTSQARKTVSENIFFLWKSHKIHDTRASVTTCASKANHDAYQSTSSRVIPIHQYMIE
mgnify:CR=1 FL=1